MGYSESTADVRLAQYESGSRTPKADLIEKLTEALEDRYGLKTGEIDGELCLRLGKLKGMAYLNMLDIFMAWREQAAKVEDGGIMKADYDQWRYTYPHLKD